MLDVVEGVALAGYDVGQLVEEGRSFAGSRGRTQNSEPVEGNAIVDVNEEGLELRLADTAQVQRLQFEHRVGVIVKVHRLGEPMRVRARSIW